MTENKKVNIVSIMWGSYLPAFIKAAAESPHLELTIFSHKEIVNDSDVLEAFFVSSQ